MQVSLQERPNGGSPKAGEESGGGLRGEVWSQQ